MLWSSRGRSLHWDVLRYTGGAQKQASGNVFKPKEGKFRLDVRWKFFTQSGEALAQLPREAVDAPLQEAFKARMDGALGNLIRWVAALPTTGSWKQTNSKVPVQSNLLVVL